MSRHLTKATTVVKAAARFKVLAAHARERREVDPEDGLAAGLLANGLSPPPPALEYGNNSSAGSRSHGERPFTPFTDNSTGSSKRVRMSLTDSLMDVVTHPDTGEQLEWYRKDLYAMYAILTGNYINLLLACVPLGIASQVYGWGAVPTFVLNFLALIPLALVLGDVTEDLAVRFGDTIGGLINATFGNVVEMILSIAALLRGLYTVVAASLLGSILSNLLLVLGCCFLLGGMRFKTQNFNALANQASSSLLFLSCIGVVIPTSAGWVLGGSGVSDTAVLSISRAAAVILLTLYVCYLAFQLFTHYDIFCDVEEEHEPMLTFFGALLMLTGITVLVAVGSEFLTASIEDFTRVTGLSQQFVGMIILPIAGNACEHITAVIVALKNKMNLSMGVAVGSSIQISIFAIPFVVIVGWITNHPFSLDFDPFSALVLTLSVLHVNFTTAAATSHWLLGAQLIAVYVLVAVVYLFRTDGI